MKTTAMHLLIALVGCCVLAASASQGMYQTRKTLQKSARSESIAEATSNSESGNATSFAEAESFGGTAFANAFASSDVQEMSADVIADATSEILNKADTGNCTDIQNVAEAEVSAKAQGLAAVYTDAFGTVEVTGEGKACTNSEAAGDAAASAFAEATAKAIIEVAGDDAMADADALVSATAAGTAAAWANAFASTCSSGGFGDVEQKSFAEAIVTPLVEVYALAIGGASCQEEAKAASSEAFVSGASMTDQQVQAGSTTTTTVMGTTTAMGGGDSGATTDVLDGDGSG